MDLGHVRTMLHLVASRLESRNIQDDREIAELLRQAERALEGAEKGYSTGPRVAAMSPMGQALSWESGPVGQGLNTGSLSEDVE